MKRILITVAASAAFFVPAAVLAQSPSPTITVVAEPPGDNCEFGGVKVTVTPAEEPEPTPEPTEEPTPDPQRSRRLILRKIPRKTPQSLPRPA